MIGEDYEAVRALEAWRRSRGRAGGRGPRVRAWPFDEGSALGRFERDLAEFLRAYAEDALIDLGVTMSEWKRQAERLSPPPLLSGRWRAADPGERAE